MSIDVNALLASGRIAGVEQHVEIDSTQTHARRLVEQLRDDQLPYLILADRQTAGRGRGDNRWWTGEGSLALSLVFSPENFQLDRPARPARSLAVGVALVDAVGPLCPDANVGLHWPNDVFIDGRKLAGVLIDLVPNERHILGLGVNTNNSLAAAPQEVRARAISLIEVRGRPVDHTLLLMSFLEHLAGALRMSADDPLRLGRRFQELCLQIGRRLVVESNGGATAGVCLGIADDGALLLDTQQGVARIYSGAIGRPEA